MAFRRLLRYAYLSYTIPDPATLLYQASLPLSHANVTVKFTALSIEAGYCVTVAWSNVTCDEYLTSGVTETRLPEVRCPTLGSLSMLALRSTRFRNTPILSFNSLLRDCYVCHINNLFLNASVRYYCAFVNIVAVNTFKRTFLWFFGVTKFQLNGSGVNETLIFRRKYTRSRFVIAPMCY